jgi:hypothetical protein
MAKLKEKNSDDTSKPSLDQKRAFRVGLSLVAYMSPSSH